MGVLVLPRWFLYHGDLIEIALLEMSQEQLRSISGGSSRRSVMATMELPKLFLSHSLGQRETIKGW